MWKTFLGLVVLAQDRAEIIGLGVTIKTPAGEFKNCLKVEESTPLEPGKGSPRSTLPGSALSRTVI
jgi:hypothetical protein